MTEAEIDFWENSKPGVVIDKVTVYHQDGSVEVRENVQVVPGPEEDDAEPTHRNP